LIGQQFFVIVKDDNRFSSHAVARANVPHVPPSSQEGSISNNASSLQIMDRKNNSVKIFVSWCPFGGRLPVASGKRFLVFKLPIPSV
jgi:hypothetical protein